MHNFLRNILLFTSVISLCMSMKPGSTRQDDDTIYWASNHRLTFADFKGNSFNKDSGLQDSNSVSTTHRLGTISKSIDVKLNTKAGKTTFKIYAGMKRNLSWIKFENDTITLKHEQGHFDICEIYARILRSKIKNATSLATAKKLFETISDEEDIEHNKYDGENTFQSGGITPYWKDKITRRLKSLEPHQNPVVSIAVAR